MAAPSKSFTVIPDSDVDPDSPITTGLMTALRDNDIHLEEWLGKNYVAAVDHDHDGSNSKVIAASGGGAIRLLESITVSGGPKSTQDFSTVLDGDTEKQYLITGFWRGVNSSRGLFLRVNGADITGSSNSTIDATRIVFAEFTGAVGTAFFYAYIKAESDADAFLDHRHMRSNASVDAGGFGQDFGGRFTPGVGTNITSLGVQCRSGAALASEISNGSLLSLYSFAR